ncbi:MAG: hypothetical protein IJD30_03980 [Clostridia bacterium]|nr:hypothetical protein [Clostridia bacterium]
MDIFCEYIVRHKNTAKDYLLIAAASVGAMLLSFIIMLFSSYLFGLGLLLIAAVWYGLYFLIKSRQIEYEYILTNSELDVDKIMGRRRRKRVISVDFKHIELCARVDDERYSHQLSSKPDKVYDFTGISDNDKYFVDFHSKDNRTRMFFQPTDKMKENIRIMNPGAIHIL